MKNFYEATVIKPTLKLDLELVITPIGSMPCQVKINGLSNFDNTIDSIATIKCQLPLTDPIEISIQLARQHPTAVQVSLHIDGYEVLPKYRHLSNPPTNYIDFNEVWVFKIPNFYPWYHEITGQGWII